MAKAPLSPGKVVLDLGCGSGNISTCLAENVAPQGRVVAVDPDAERIKIAQEKYGGETNVTFVVGSDAEFPGCRTETYDVIYSNFVFHWIRDKRRALKTIYESLKPGGTLVFCVPIEIPVPLRGLNELMPAERARKLLNRIHHETSFFFKNACMEAGFKIVSHEETPHCAYFKCVEDLCVWWAASTHGAFDSTLVNTESLKKISFLRDNNGQIVLQHRCLSVVVVK